MDPNKGRKLKIEHEDPINNILSVFVDCIAPVFYKLNITPNQVTLLSFVLSLSSVYYLLKNNLRMAALLWGMSYFFDCLDGYMARRYKLFSKYGDYYDHFSDTIGYLGLIYVLWRQKKYNTIKILLFMLIPLKIHLSCRENIYDKKEESETLNIIDTCLDPLNTIKYSRWFGDGFHNLLIVFLILNKGLK